MSRDTKVPADLVIPPRPQVVEALMRERSREEPDLQRLERLLATDIGLAGALIKTANSPLLGLRQRVTTLGHAFQMLGMSNVINIASGLVLRHLMKGGEAPAMERFWDTTERVALIGGALARKLRAIGQDEAYAYCLFHDCGIPVLMQRFAQYKDVLRAANAQPDRAFVDVEESLLGTSHAAVGSLLARNWGLADEMSEAILFHHDMAYFVASDSPLSGKTRSLIGLGHLAEHIHHASKRASDDVEWAKFGDMVLVHFGLSTEDYNDLLESFEDLAPA